MRKKYIPFLLLGAAMTVSCGKQIPKDIIQPAEMEDLLYDYHLAISLGADLPNMENVDKEGMKKYALEKHHISQAEFDSSMVWYTRHANFLYDIFTQLEKRFLMAENRMKTQINKRSGQITISLSGDTVDVWSDRDLYWLTASSLTNKVTFNLKADTTFRPTDALCLEANFTFLSPDSLPASSAVVGLNIKFADNETSQSIVKTVTTSGFQKFYLKSDSKIPIAKVTGFIYCSSTDSTSSDILVNGIKLMRYHEKSEGNVISEENNDREKTEPRISNRQPRNSMRKNIQEVSER